MNALAEFRHLRIPPAIRSTKADPDGCVVLDLRSGRMWSLNQLGSRVWRALENGQPLADCVEALHRENDDVSYGAVCGDVTRLVARLESAGLLRTPESTRSDGWTSAIRSTMRSLATRARPASSGRELAPELWRGLPAPVGANGTEEPRAHASIASTHGVAAAAASHADVSTRHTQHTPTARTRMTMEEKRDARHSPNALVAFAGLLAVELLFLLTRFHRLHDLVGRYPVRACVPSPHAEVDALRALDRAQRWYPRQAQCLQRSCVLTGLLRRSGVSAALVVGARVLPFYAHAWVEVDGRIVGDRASVREQYRILTRC